MPTEDDIREALRDIYDPDIPANVVDLGLVYNIRVDGDEVTIKMTLSTPGSPHAEHIREEITERLFQVDGVEGVQVDIVWEPSWHPDLMSEEAKASLGM